MPFRPVVATMHIPLAQYGQHQARVAAGMRGAMERALARAGAQGVGLLRSATRARGIRDLGGFERGWAVRQSSWQQLRFYNSSPYAPFVENGRRAGARMPPPAALVPWVERHFGVTGAAARGLAFVIARRIAQRGIRARRVLTDPLVQAQLTAEVNDTLAAQLAQVHLAVPR